jgi:hypothetical protein
MPSQALARLDYTKKGISSEDAHLIDTGGKQYSVRAFQTSPGIEREYIEKRGYDQLEPGLLSDEQIEGGGTYYVGAEQATPFNERHEARHAAAEADNQRMSEETNRLWDAFAATTPSEWEEAVDNWKRWHKLDSFEEAEKDLKATLKERKDFLLDREARTGYEGEMAVANPPDRGDQVGLLEAYRKQAEELFEYRQRAIDQGRKGNG